jgi:2-oxo-4-hydroxy-4-carboxy--5-ureidoimidazoline (OHCU) decarboxylase
VLLCVLEINRVDSSKKVLERQAADKLALLRSYPLMTGKAQSSESAGDEDL